jgi:hypothetical protein
MTFSAVPCRRGKTHAASRVSYGRSPPSERVKIPGARRTKLHWFQDAKGLQNLAVSTEGSVHGVHNGTDDGGWLANYYRGLQAMGNVHDQRA